MANPKPPKCKTRECREIRKYLKALVDYNAAMITWIDAEMKKPSTVERGQRFAKVLNELELENDRARMFGLGEKQKGAK